MPQNRFLILFDSTDCSRNSLSTICCLLQGGQKEQLVSSNRENQLICTDCYLMRRLGDFSEIILEFEKEYFTLHSALGAQEEERKNIKCVSSFSV